MGWLWGDDDPLKQLDPSLRAYLEQENQNRSNTATSSKRRPTQQPPQSTPQSTTQQPQAPSPPQPSTDASPNTWRSFFGLKLGDTLLSAEAKHQATKEAAAAAASSTTSNSTLTTTTSTAPPPPPESLYPDGRYAALWATYRSERETSEAGKSDQEKLHDILHGYQERTADLKRAALENCANEQWAIHTCFKKGGVSARMTMCRAENRELERCVTLQSRFLKALGYVSMWERPAEESERMQMHADSLYLRMKAQERAIEEARAKGEPALEFGPLIRRHEDGSVVEEGEGEGEVAVAPPITRTFESLPEDLRGRLMAGRFEGLSGPALEVAKRELEQELATHTALMGRFDERWRQERRERLGRFANGEERVSDKIRRWFDLTDYTKIDEQEAQMVEERERKMNEQTERANATAA